MKRGELQEHFFNTYLSLRFGMALIAAAYPVVVYLAGRFDGVPLQDSISAYYWATATGEYRARVWFVGGLFAVAAFLYLYKGFTAAENVALNLAAAFAVGVAVFPMEWDCQDDCGGFSLHGCLAIAMFACLVYVVWFRARDTLRFLPPDSNPARYRRLYGIVGAVMLASPVTAFLMVTVTGTHTTYEFFVEAAGIWAFSAYWWIKSTELRNSGATGRALRAEIAT